MVIIYAVLGVRLTTCLSLNSRLQESSKSEDTRINGPGASNYTLMNKETTKEMEFYLMKIHLRHIQLVVSLIVCSSH